MAERKIPQNMGPVLTLVQALIGQTVELHNIYEKPILGLLEAIDHRGLILKVDDEIRYFSWAGTRMLKPVK